MPHQPLLLLALCIAPLALGEYFDTLGLEVRDFGSLKGILDQRNRSGIERLIEAIELVEEYGEEAGSDDAFLRIYREKSRYYPESEGDCTVPVCDRPCEHNGNCTAPNVCTCEKGWRGDRCEEPICAQECLNGGICVAPDTCKCAEWPNSFRDGRGIPVYQTDNGSFQKTGFTGFDCSTPICTQGGFVLNIDPNAILNADLDADPSHFNLIELGGRGKDGRLECDTARCPAYDEIGRAHV